MDPHTTHLLAFVSMGSCVLVPMLEVKEMPYTKRNVYRKTFIVRIRQPPPPVSSIWPNRCCGCFTVALVTNCPAEQHVKRRYKFWPATIDKMEDDDDDDEADWIAAKGTMKRKAFTNYWKKTSRSMTPFAIHNIHRFYLQQNSVSFSSCGFFFDGLRLKAALLRDPPTVPPTHVFVKTR